ncbi:MAG: PSD1 and planctomycete cytochrome C domain-containing protein [Fimbriimonas sp.]|nr:PSD1 and planctomycete cytochrome C domain-containing protein [Fimbriimonas sp.]
MKPSILVPLALYGFLGYVAVQSPSPKPPPRVSFDRDIMPIIGQKCFKCHGPDVSKAAAGLRLDSFAGATKALYDGSAIVPRHPEQSKMIERVSERREAFRMPPADSGVKPLTAEQIELVRTWIHQGAQYEKHWSYLPPSMPSLPTVSHPDWCKNSIDRFVLAKLDEAGLKPEPEADRDTLAMRASQALTGLAPTSRDLTRFRNDRKPGAYERFVDRLLTETTYGENQARYWLDAVRYADTHGLQLDNERGIYPYRDWVVRAFNRDLPFNKFALFQLAGDLLPNPTNEQLVATGYVRANLTSNEGGAIPEEFLARNTFDRVDTTSTVFLGLTFGCAKCHDHKYDPIKQKDYYGLYAFFDSTKDKPLDDNILLPPPVVRAPYPDQEARLASMQRELDRLRDEVDPKQAVTWLGQRSDEEPTTSAWQISPVYRSASFDEAFDKPEPAEPGQTGDAVWKPLKFEIGKDEANLVGVDNASVYVRGVVRFRTAKRLQFGVSSDDAVRVWLNGKLIHSNKVNRGVDQGIDKVTGDFHAGDNQLVVKVINGISVDGLNIRFADPDVSAIKKVVASYRAEPSAIENRRELCATFLRLGPSNPTSQRYRALDKSKAELENAIPMTLIAQEMENPRPTFILKRGQYDQIGDPVVRHLPAALGQLPAGAPLNRLGLADWMVSPSNPLVSRVFVNRVWQQHFGVGIVKTSEDFGSQGEWPVNQQLLDYLAVTFERNGWSVKQLNRLIVTSATFRQSSRISRDKLLRDPENRLVSRGPRFRLDAEVIRDKALAAGGLLELEQGGHGFKPYQPSGLWEGASDPASGTHIYVRDKDRSIYRRSIYLFWKRTAPPPVMVTFDAPLRDTCTVRRAVTNTPLQALTTMNEPEFLEASRLMAQHLLQAKGGDDDRLIRACQIAWGRAPRPKETDVLKHELSQFRTRYKSDPSDSRKLLAVGDSPQSPTLSPSEQASWMLLCSTLMNTDEFLTQH